MKELIKKIALFGAYCVFAGYSSWMTATSAQLKWMSQMPVWFVFIMIFIIALFAGWCLGNVIKELKNSINPSKVRFALSLLGFIVFWAFSFMTNVHYNVIQEYGASNLSTQLADCKQYLLANSDEAVEKIENERDNVIKNFEHNIYKQREQFLDELRNPQGNGTELVGFGPRAKTFLKEIENILNTSAKTYEGANKYSIYDPKIDEGYSRYRRREDVVEIVIPYFTDKIDRAEAKHKEAIKGFYQGKINRVKNNTKLLKTVADYEKMLQDLEKEGHNSFSEYFKFYQAMDKHLLTQVDSYKKTYLKYKKDGEGNETFDGYRIYPSDRMFNIWDVWEDWFRGYLPENISLSGQFLWSIIVDVIAFILISLI